MISIVQISPILQVWTYDILMLKGFYLENIFHRIHNNHILFTIMGPIDILLFLYHQINYAAIFLLLFMIWLSFMVYSEADRFRNGSFNQSFFACKETKRNSKIVHHIKTKIGEYQPPWWYNPHIGTILSLGNFPNLQYERQVFSDEFSNFPVDWYPSMPSIKSIKTLKICVFLPGLGLSSRSKFAQKFLQVLEQDGFTSVVVNAQGIEMPLKQAKFWHPGHYHDAKAVLNFIYCHYPKSQVYLVGFSAGSNIIHKLVLNYEKKQDFIKAAVAVCVNGDYLASRKHLESTIQGKIYSALVTLGNKDIIRKNEHVHSAVDPVSISKLLSCRFASEYDAIVWEILHDFSNENEYYEAISSNFSDKRLNIPYLAIQPRDDPLHAGNTRENVRIRDFYENPYTIYMEPRYGNHFGFYEGSLFQAFSNQSTYTYPAKVASEFFRLVTENEDGDVQK